MYRSAKRRWSIAWLLLPPLVPPVPLLAGQLAERAGAQVHIHSTWGILTLLGFGLALGGAALVMSVALPSSILALVRFPENRTFPNCVGVAAAFALIGVYSWYLLR